MPTSRSPQPAKTAPDRGIRPLTEADLPQVTSIYERVIRSGSTTPAPGLEDYFRRTFLEHPWVDPELPSLVAEDDGAIVGFLGSHARRLRLDDRELRMGCSGQLVVSPEARHDALGAFLVNAYLAGTQDLTITDGANEPAELLWERLGGEALHVSCIEWVRVFRPTAAAAQYASRRPQGPAPRMLRPLTAVLDTVARRLPHTRFRPPRPEGRTEPLTAEALVEQLPALTRRTYRLHAAYDEPFLEWLFRELEAVPSRGEVMRTLVRDDDGGVLGWYIAYVVPGGVGEAVQVAASGKNAGAVLDHLFQEASARGATAVRGRIEPQLLSALWGRRCMLRFGTGALVHSRSPEVLQAIRSGQALLTRLDGEWWMGHHLEPFT
jgi:hypothetical protein